MYVDLVLLVVFFAVVAMLVREGLWSNAISFFNVMTAAMLASNYFETLADWLTKKFPSYTYLLDFLSLWAIFCAVLIVLRLLTDRISRVKVRFKMPVEWAGGIFFALWVGWIMVCFTTFSLHTAPLARNSFGGDFQPTPTSDMFFGLAPDRQWLAWMHTMSLDGAARPRPPRGKQNPERVRSPCRFHPPLRGPPQGLRRCQLAARQAGRNKILSRTRGSCPRTGRGEAMLAAKGVGSRFRPLNDPQCQPASWRNRLPTLFGNGGRKPPLRPRWQSTRRPIGSKKPVMVCRPLCRRPRTTIRCRSIPIPI